MVRFCHLRIQFTTITDRNIAPRQLCITNCVFSKGVSTHAKTFRKYVGFSANTNGFPQIQDPGKSCTFRKLYFLNSKQTFVCRDIAVTLRSWILTICGPPDVGIHVNDYNITVNLSMFSANAVFSANSTIFPQIRGPGKCSIWSNL